MKMTLIAAFVPEYLCSAVLFHDVMTPFMLPISKPSILGPSVRAAGLRPLIDFPIESETWDQHGTDRPPLFPFLRRSDDLTGGRMPSSAPRALARLHQLKSCC